MNQDLTTGSTTKKMLLFAFPLMIGNLLQQLYNIADTIIVGKFLGSNAIAAVGSAYALMIFITSIILGLCMGSGALFSIRYGEKNFDKLKSSIFVSFLVIGGLSILLNILSFLGIDLILRFMKIPSEIYDLMKDYTLVIFGGILGVFLYNYFSSLLRAVGNSFIPLVFLTVSVILNIFLDFILIQKYGIKGAAYATIISQIISGVSLSTYTFIYFPYLTPKKENRIFKKSILKEILHFSILTCIQQSVMNFGILMVQGLVNSFGTVVMAAFSVAVKIDSFAYMPVQDFGNAFSTFIAQNYGAKEFRRIKEGIKNAIIFSTLFSILVSIIVWGFAENFLLLFIKKEEIEILKVGIEYLHIEGAFYFGIGFLFLLYGYYRAVEKPGISVVLTIISLGTRVILAYVLSSFIGTKGIWWSVPIGWFLADITGIIYYFYYKNNKISLNNIYN